MSTKASSVIEGIDRHLPYLHKERWSEDHAKLREVARTATGDEQAKAQQAVRDHLKTRNRPETTRDFFIQQATANHTAQRQA